MAGCESMPDWRGREAIYIVAMDSTPIKARERVPGWISQGARTVTEVAEGDRCCTVLFPSGPACTESSPVLGSDVWASSDRRFVGVSRSIHRLRDIFVVHWEDSLKPATPMAPAKQEERMPHQPEDRWIPIQTEC